MDIQNILKQLAAKKKQGNIDKQTTKKRPRNEPMTLGVLREAEPTFVSQNFGVRVYDFEGRKSLQEILAKSKLKARFNQQARNYTSLIDDLEFPVATSCIRLAADENHLFAAGVYPPQIRCYVLDEMTMKFQRNCDSEVIKVLPLLSDYKKLALLQMDRWVELHAQFGTYYKYRIPKPGRDIAYHAQSAELITVGSGSEICRFNLEQGMFRKPIEAYSPDCGAINIVRINPVHQLIGLGCENGYVECIDPRSKTVAGVLDACDSIRTQISCAASQVTSFEFDANGVTFAAGTNLGQVGLFDLRKSGVIHTKDHNYDSPIVAMGFHDITKNIFTADRRVVKIWNKESGDILANLEQSHPISDVIMMPASGMMMIGGDKPKIKPLYIPALGPAPKWCSFVDTVTEELEEIKKVSVYQDFKLVTLEELQELGLQDLLGTDVLRPHLHGFLIKMSLYKRALEFYQSGANVPEKTDEEIEQENEKAIRQNRVDQLMTYLNQEDKNENGSQKNQKKSAKKDNSDQMKIQSVGDERFEGLFEDPDFERDEDEESRVKKRQKTKKDNKSKKEKEKDSKVNLYGLQIGQTISYKDSDLLAKPSDVAKEKKKPLAERIAENERKNKGYSITNIKGGKEMTIDSSDDDDTADSRETHTREKPQERRTVPKRFLKPIPGSKRGGFNRKK